MCGSQTYSGWYILQHTCWRGTGVRGTHRSLRQELATGARCVAGRPRRIAGQACPAPDQPYCAAMKYPAMLPRSC